MSGSIIAIPLFILAAIAAIGLGVFVLIVFFRVIGKLLVHVFGTIGAFIGDIFRFIGATIVALVFIPLILANVMIGRWSASAHYGRAFTAECKTASACVYRVLIGHPLRLIGLHGLTEGIEQRLPLAMAEAPGADKPSKRQGLFEGYTIIGSLPGGGSGGKLYIAEPDALKQAAFERKKHVNVEHVVIKTFSLSDGSSLPQIVRESRALDAAKKMGLVLEHELTDERFFYIMRYVPGDSLTIATQRLHADTDGKGLGTPGLRLAVGYAGDLLEALDVYHRGGLWHKDVKPDNLIVDRETDPALGRGKAHLVDFGLITPLRSAMTLTTHGTEYFRDPELVRQALRGVKVHQIDGAKFDVYGAGAVLFSMIENSFPAHGGLSQVSNRCPEALRWIIRRSMTDYDKRYPTARAMLDDLTVLIAAEDPFTVKPADLPSMRGGDVPTPAPIPEPMPDPVVVSPAAASPVPPRAAVPATPMESPVASPAHSAERGPLPKLRVTHWWSGKYEVDRSRAQSYSRPPANNPANNPVGFVQQVDIGGGQRVARPVTPPGARKSASEQLASARQRVKERRARTQRGRGRGRSLNAAYGPTRIAGRRKRAHEPAGVNAGVVIASILAVLFFGGVVFALLVDGGHQGSVTVNTEIARTPPEAPLIPQPVVPVDPSLAQISVEPVLIGLVPAPTRTTDGLGLVFLSDFRPPFDEHVEAELGRAETELLGAGVQTMSNLISEDNSGDAGSEDLVATLLKVRGQSMLDESLGREITEFIETHDQVDAVWWIGHGEDDDMRRYLLVTPAEVSNFESDGFGLDQIAAIFVRKAPAPAPASTSTIAD